MGNRKLLVAAVGCGTQHVVLCHTHSVCGPLRMYSGCCSVEVALCYVLLSLLYLTHTANTGAFMILFDDCSSIILFVTRRFQPLRREAPLHCTASNSTSVTRCLIDLGALGPPWLNRHHHPAPCPRGRS